MDPMTIAALVSGGMGLVGNLFGGKGKKTEYTSMEPRWMQELRKGALGRLDTMSQTGPIGMGPTMQAYQNLMQRFYPGQGGGMPQMGGGMPGQGAPQMGGGMPGGGMPGGGMPQMGGQFPSYADGGIAWGPQLAQVGERGPEAIVPLRNMMGQMGGPSPVPGGASQMSGGMQNMMGQMGSPQQMPGGMQNMMGQMGGPPQGGAGQMPAGMQNMMGGMQGQMGQQSQMPGSMQNMMGGLQGQQQQMGQMGGLQGMMGGMQGRFPQPQGPVSIPSLLGQFAQRSPGGMPRMQGGMGRRPQARGMTRA